jgi:hypothetical protein
MVKGRRTTSRTTRNRVGKGSGKNDEAEECHTGRNDNLKATTTATKNM